MTVFSLLFLSSFAPVLEIPPVKQSTTLAQNAQQQEIEALALPSPMYLPHPGYLSTKFFFYHPGIDIAAGYGMPVHPIAKGVVEQVNYGFLGYGNNMIINHAAGFKSMYAHLGKIFIKAGQNVDHENIIGEVGMTGRTSGPHTHLEITKDGKYIDPLTILPEISTIPAKYKAAAY